MAKRLLTQDETNLLAVRHAKRIEPKSGLPMPGHDDPAEWWDKLQDKHPDTCEADLKEQLHAAACVLLGTDPYTTPTKVPAVCADVLAQCKLAGTYKTRAEVIAAEVAAKA